MRNPPFGPWKHNEHVLGLDPPIILQVGRIVRRFPGRVILDYSFQSSCRFDDDESAFSPTNRTDLYVRHVIGLSLEGFMPIGKVPPLRGFLEVEAFGRQWLVDHFARSSAVKSMTLLTFIDGFGLYRSMYKSVMGKYYCIGSLERAEAIKQDNIILGTLGPHGSNFGDVLKALEPMKALDQGMHMMLDGNNIPKLHFVCVLYLAITSDTP